MASQLIAHVAAWYIPTGQPLVNDMDGLTIDGAYRLEAQRMHAELERRARGQPLCVEIDIRPVKNKRTLDQNRLMWALLNRLALALSGDTPGGVTAEQCYLDLLAEFGAEVETWRVPVKALPALRNTYRVVQMVELLDDGYCSKTSQATAAMRWQAASLAAGSSAVRSTLYVSKFTPPSPAIVARESEGDNTRRRWKGEEGNERRAAGRDVLCECSG